MILPLICFIRSFVVNLVVADRPLMDHSERINLLVVLCQDYALFRVESNSAKDLL